jgi:hypothetical protein
MNEDIPIYSIVLLKIIAVVQVIFGSIITFFGSYMITSLRGEGSLLLPFLFVTCLGMFAVYAGILSFSARLSVFNWVLNCVLLAVFGAIYTYYNISTPMLFPLYLSVALLGIAGVILSGKYEKYQLRESLQDFPDLFSDTNEEEPTPKTLPEDIKSELIKIHARKKIGGVMNNQDSSEKSKPGGQDTGQLTKDDSVSPLNSSDQGKLLIFSLLMVPSLVFLFGVIPTIFLAFGIYMMKKNQDFSSIDTAVKIFKGYMWISFVVAVVIVSYWFDAWTDGWGVSDEELVFLFLGAAIPIAYLIAVSTLFYSPLKKHREWVVVNGIFSAKPKSVTKPGIELEEVNIIKGEKLKQYSVVNEQFVSSDDASSEVNFGNNLRSDVALKMQQGSTADELLKWKNLLDEGAITQEEYEKAKRDLLS